MTNSISTRVVTAVAEANGIDFTDLPPLYHAIDPDALEALAGSCGNGTDRRRRDCELRFSYGGRDVRIRNGEVTVGPTSRRSE